MWHNSASSPPYFQPPSRPPITPSDRRFVIYGPSTQDTHSRLTSPQAAIRKLPLPMSLWRAYQGLSSRARLGVGLGLLAWGTIGLTWGDEIAEARKFLKFSDKDKAQLEKMAPKIVVVDSREEKS
ncbi:hypothetical protein RB598_001609 [Gaeumannomyces tritici]